MTATRRLLTGRSSEFVDAIDIGTPVRGGTPDRVLFVDAAGEVAQDTGLVYDPVAKILKIQTVENPGPQLRLGDDSVYLDFQIYNDDGAFASRVDLVPSPAANGAFCQVRVVCSDMCLSYTKQDSKGIGVPNLTLSGPGAMGFTADSGPGINLNDELSALDEKLYSIFLEHNSINFSMVNDANNSSNAFITVTRTGINVTNFALVSDNFVFTRSSDLTKNMDVYVDSGGVFHMLPVAGGGLSLDTADGHILIPNAVSAAGGGAGTLLNAPHAGNPDFYLRLNCGGTVYKFPGWI